MIDAARLRDDLQELVVQLEGDLRDQLLHDPVTIERLRSEHAAARAASRTAQEYEAWRDAEVTQAAVAYVLSCVFVRFLEDNHLIGSRWLAGPLGPQLDAAQETRTAWLQQHPRELDLGYLRAAFADVARLPAMHALFDERHNASWSIALSPEGAAMLYAFWQRCDDAGALVHDFTDATHSTRFLGDLYQDLSAAARDRYALIQTPEFVEEFILDRTLEPAIAEFGIEKISLLDPACGSGHFLLGAFARLLQKWRLVGPGQNMGILAQRALDALAGADLNPYAIAVARFRLLIAALHASGIEQLAGARDFRVHLAVADSLLHGKTWGARKARQISLQDDDLSHIYRAEDAASISDVLGRRYHVVVGNPPHVTVKDATLNSEYRRYGSCRGRYSLTVPFIERFFDMALPSENGAGYVGIMTANSFTKREFGKALVESYLPRWDLTHVVDTSAAYLPNHGTPMLLLFGRNRPPTVERVRVVAGIRGEPSLPEDPAHGRAWLEIARLIDRDGEAGEFVSTSDVRRELLAKHPWTIAGGGATELKDLLDEAGIATLGAIAASIGTSASIGEIDHFTMDGPDARRRLRIEACRPLVRGDGVRDWQLGNRDLAVWPYDDSIALRKPEAIPNTMRLLWPARTYLKRRRQLAREREWFEWTYLHAEKSQASLSIAFPTVATHNHFVLVRGGMAFDRTSPIMTLPAGATEDEHLGVVGLLNSSIGSFWTKMVSFSKRGPGLSSTDGAGDWQRLFEFSGAALAKFPVAENRPANLARRLDDTAARLLLLRPERLVAGGIPTRETLDASRATQAQLREQMIFLQEELDWWCYAAYDLAPDDLILNVGGSLSLGIRRGERAFEIAMAREVASGRLKTSWFEGLDSPPVTEIPSHWPAGYRALVERRVREIRSNPRVHQIERPEFKRRWNEEPWADQEARALRDWLLARMEDRKNWFSMNAHPQITSCAGLAARLREDKDFVQVASLYRGHAEHELTELVVDLVQSASVPFLSTYRYSEEGRRKRATWDRTWDLQRQEDAIDARTRLAESDPLRLTSEQAAAEKARHVADIEAPPKYAPADFAKATYWRLRGALDVSRERFITYPGAERDADATPVVGWAGWDHLERAQALAELIVTVRENEAWPRERIAPLLAGVDELIPWLKQWHNERDPMTGEQLGDYFAEFVIEEASSLDTTLDDLRALAPREAPSEGGGSRSFRLPLERVVVHAFRSLANVDLASLGRFNLLVGLNNAGKSTVLEAVATLVRPLQPNAWLEVVQRRDSRSTRASLIEGLKWLFPGAATTDKEEPFEGETRVEGVGRSTGQSIVHFRDVEGIVEDGGTGAMRTEEKAAAGAPPSRVTRGAELTFRLESGDLSGQGPADRSDEYQLTIWENGIAPIEESRSGPLLPMATITPFTHRAPEYEVNAVSEAIFRDRKAALVDLLRIFDPNVEDVEVLKRPRSEAAVYVRHKRLGKAPLSAFGDGMRRVLLLGVSLSAAQGGVLLVDEIESAIHVEALQATFEWLQRACRELDVQLVATTHSLEAIDALLASGEYLYKDELVVYRLERRDEQTIVKRFGTEEVRVLREELGQELRR